MRSKMTPIETLTPSLIPIILLCTHDITILHRLAQCTSSRKGVHTSVSYRNRQCTFGVSPKKFFGGKWLGDRLPRGKCVNHSLFYTAQFCSDIPKIVAHYWFAKAILEHVALRSSGSVGLVTWMTRVRIPSRHVHHLIFHATREFTLNLLLEAPSDIFLGSLGPSHLGNSRRNPKSDRRWT